MNRSSVQLSIAVFVGCLVLLTAPFERAGFGADQTRPEEGRRGALARVTVRAGVIQGVAEPGGLAVFKGVPFAEPPVGALRWKPPQPVQPWQGVRSAQQFAPAAVQDEWLPSLAGVPRDHSEDCLYLNVWTPTDRVDAKLPVMVWIHGGAFVFGSTSQPTYDGARLARRGVVVVTVGYRLGALGFLACPELSREQGGVSGNYGLRDMIAALQWVRENIAAFGGDPHCVTIFGESAGGGAVSVLASSPRARGLFQRVICESGPGFTPPRTSAQELLQLQPRLALAEREGEAYLSQLHVKSIAEARALPAEALLKVHFNAGSTIDGDLLPDDQYLLYTRGKFNDTPVLVGSNSNDGGMFVLLPMRPADFVSGAARLGPFGNKFLALYPHETVAETTRSAKDLVGDVAFRWPARTWARLQTQHGSHRAFVYYFDHPAGDAGHASELPFVFGNAPLFPLAGNPWHDAERKLSDLMSSYWVNFARSGDPNGPGLPPWSAFNPSSNTLMTLDAAPGMKPAPHPERLALLDDYFAWRRTQPAN